ncbi:dTDP-glucose 4,6-dehydratase [Ligilactobacillus ceti]|uniref:dTDP-glucose 4,6-dehydratase n=1 Tax=Ligilactobacillus ceti DSM 22408 TaxID=1122146 RepID=A0A0R2KG57_9LACO|nr:dTDP-glucose 4,6-dehydratase [Ligilactobacillus ceti]KRN88377.1 hypothetical protein IV53_GL000341 [Ligilactobacillus ceti DSM 22408]
MKNILVTGGAGFIGSNFIKMLVRKGRYHIVNLDALTYAGHLENLTSIENNSRYTFVKGNICDQNLVNKIFTQYKIDTVVNFAAESHVDNSVLNPGIFLQTNVMGTEVLLQAAQQAWKFEPTNPHSKEYYPNVKFLQVSTDEVYGSLGAEGFFTEKTPLQPNSPYSASKAAADLLVRSYFQTYGLPMNITRCSNNYGPYQYPEKLIPLMINNALQQKQLPIYGDGQQIRDWLYVSDHCEAIYTVLTKGKNGEIYNIGGNNEKSNLEIVHLILTELGQNTSLIEHVIDRPGHDRRYAIDNHKITTELNWQPKISFEQGIKQTINWYQENRLWLEQVQK